MTNHSGDYVWYELLTPDIAAARAFYGPLLGWNLRDSGTPGMDYHLASSGEGQEVAGVMALTDEMIGEGARPMWLGYVAVDDVDATLAAMVADGAVVHMPAFDIPNVGRMAMLADPQGVPFYIMRGASDETSYAFAFDRPRVGHVAWNELSASDPAAAWAFYGRHFGWTKDGEMAMGELGNYEFVRGAGPDSGVLGAIMPVMPGAPGPSWTFYFRVPDIDAGTRAIRDSGGTVVQEAMEIPGGEYALVALDPRGAAFGLVGPRL